MRATGMSGAIPTRRYPGTRIIFTDTEKSNWTWDPVAQAYYWHRFFSHQPDLNFDNPRVLEAMLSGDAALARYRRRRLPARRDPLSVRARGHQQRKPARDARGHQDDPRASSTPTRPDRMLLAEANQWPEDVQHYFGDGDECHMAYPLPADAAHVHGDRAGGPLPDHRHPAADAGHPGELPVGAVPAQPRRADARDGDRRGARLPVVAPTPPIRARASISASAAGWRR